MEPIKINHKELEKEIESGNTYIQVGSQKYLLMEVNEVYEYDSYEVTDSDEEQALSKALKEENPIISSEEVNNYLGIDK